MQSPRKRPRHLFRPKSRTSYQQLEPRQMLASLSDFTMLSHGETFGYVASDQESISAGSTQTYTIDLESNQRFSIRVIGEGNFNPDVSVVDPNGISLGSDGTGATNATLNNLPVDTSGNYVVSVEGFNGSVGDYEIEVIINTVFESEVIGTETNEVFTDAEPITNWIDPGNYLVNPVDTNSEIGVTYGSLVGEGVTFNDDFETGNLDSRWTTNSSTSNGVIEATNLYGASSGSYSLVMATSQNGVDNLNEAILDFPISASVPYLQFSYTQWNDEATPLPESFTGSFDGDGVSVSDDGVEWHTIFDAPTTINGEWAEFEINLHSFANALDLSLFSLQIKFQQFGDSTLSNDGRAFDNIRVNELWTQWEPGSHYGNDWYSFEVAEQESISIATRRTNGTRSNVGQGVAGFPSARAHELARTNVFLYDSNGDLLEGTTSNSIGYNYDDVILDYDAAPGTYHVRVTGSGFEEYLLLVGRNIDLDGDSDATQNIVSSLATGDSIIAESESWATNHELDFFTDVTLTDDIAGGSIYYVRTDGAFRAPSGAGVYASEVDNPEGFLESVNEMRGDFTKPVYRVSIDIGSDDESDSGFLRAYSASGDLLEEVVSGNLPSGNKQTLTINRPTADIAYFIASGNDGDPTPLDRLEFFYTEFQGNGGSFELARNETVNLSVVALGSAPGNPDLELSDNLAIYLYDDDGLIETDSEFISYKASEAGTFSVFVWNTDEAAFGGFFLNIERVTAANVTFAGIGYGGSSFADDNPIQALATDKSPLFNGQTATFDNYTSYSRGINNIVLTVNNLSPHMDINDFVFKTGRTDDTSTWDIAPTPTLEIKDVGFPVLSLNWQDNEIENTWLQVKILADEFNGLSNDTTFYFGNAIAETGNDPNNTRVNLADIGLTRSNQTAFTPAAIDNVYDFDRDRRVNLADIGIARSNQTAFVTLPLITPFESSNKTGDSGSKTDDTKSKFSRFDQSTDRSNFGSLSRNQQIQSFDLQPRIDESKTKQMNRINQVDRVFESALSLTGSDLVIDESALDFERRSDFPQQETERTESSPKALLGETMTVDLKSRLTIR